MSNPETLERRIQLSLFWGNTPLDAVTVPEKPGEVLAGSQRSCQVPFPPEVLPYPDFPLLKILPDGVTVRAGKDSKLSREEAGAWVSIPVHDGVQPGVVEGEMPPSGTVQLSLGRLNLLISRVQVAPPRRGPIADQMEPAFVSSLLVVFFLAAAFIATLLLSPGAASSEELRLDKNNAAYLVAFIGKAERPRPLVVFDQVRKNLVDDIRALSPKSGDPGKAGLPGAPDVNQRSAQRGPRPDNREIVSHLGVLALAPNAPGKAGNLLGPRHGLSGDLVDAIGHLTGPVPGNAGGSNGLADFGHGPGSGGDRLQTLSGTPLEHNPRLQATAPKSHYTPGIERGPNINFLPPRFPPSLPKEVVRQVIHSHRDQIRYCYEHELSLHPTLGGSVSVRFVVGEDGNVRAADANHNIGPHGASLAGCIIEKVRTWQFPSPKGGGEVEVRYPFRFSPSGDRAGEETP